MYTTTMKDTRYKDKLIINEEGKLINNIHYLIKWIDVHVHTLLFLEHDRFATLAMFLVALYLWTGLHVVLSDNATYCASGFRYANSDYPINVTESCNETSPCIGKCCPANQILVLNISDNKLLCVYKTNLTLTYNITNLDDYSEIEFYKSDIVHYVKKSTKKMHQFIQFYSEDFIDGGCSMDVTPIFKPPAHKIYLLENGSSVIRRLNTMKQWFLESPPGRFCVEHQIALDNGTVSKPKLVIRMKMTGGEDNPDTATRNKIFTFGLLVSCVFLALVLAVYAVLPQLRNMAGMILMAYVATLMTAFILRAAQVLAPDSNLITKNDCMWLGLMAIYTLVASFTWMNVMSFDIWWSMRGFRKLRQIHRRGVLVKLGWYALYGWGAPLLLVIFMIVVENLDLSHMPDFIKSQYSDPNSCFIESELPIYLYAPILITTCINLTLFLLTAYNIWRIKRGVSQHSAGDSRRNKNDETRFGFYLKLSLVMGINWILEVASSFCEPKSVWWYAPDVFNSLIGLCIFIIFICKKNIIVLLCKRFSIGHELVRKWHHEESKCTDSARSNGKYSSRKKMDSVTDTSYDYEHEKSNKQ